MLTFLKQKKTAEIALKFVILNVIFLQFKSKNMMDSSENKTIPKVLLIDLENCPSQINELLDNLKSFSLVVICYAQTGVKIPLDWLVPLSCHVNNQRLKILKIPNQGKNAADFGISFFAGMLIQQLPIETHFVIISEDTDLDQVINLLKNQGRTAERIGTQKTSTPDKKFTMEDLSSVIKTFCKSLLANTKNRPTKRETLKNSIQARFKNLSVETEQILNFLEKEQAIHITESKITYNDEQLKQLSQ